MTEAETQDHTAENFEGCIGQVFRVAGGGASLTLASVARFGDVFRFHVMPVHTLAGDRQDYQAVFN